MKIEKEHAVKISARTAAFEVLKNIKKGGAVTARIVERTGPRGAVLEIAGHRMRADFLKGVPLENRFTLVLADRSDRTLVFRIKEREAGGQAAGMFDYTLYKAGDIDRAGLARLSRYIGDGVPGLFALNSFLMKLAGEKEKKDFSITGFLNRLLRKGIKREDLLLLSYLFTGGRGGTRGILASLVTAMGMEQGVGLEGVNEDPGDNQRLGEKMDTLARLIGEQEESGGLEGFLGAFLDPDDPGGRRVISGEIPFWEGGEFRPVRYLGREGSLIVSLELSVIGPIEILARDGAKAFQADFFLEKDGAREALERGAGTLKSALGRQLDKDIITRFYNSRDIAKKIIEINDFMVSHSGLDIKV